MGDQTGVVRFVSHSVVRGQDGTLFDITPKGPTFTDYPFLESHLDTDPYADIVNPLYEQLGAAFLHHLSLDRIRVRLGHVVGHAAHV